MTDSTSVEFASEPDSQAASESAVTVSGHCMCGSVSFEITGQTRPVWNCHCWRCRRWTGHFMAATNCRQSDLRFLSTDTLRWHYPADDPNVAYGFCGGCGGSLFWKVVEGPGDQAELIAVCAGTLDRPTGLVTEGMLFADDASDYHVLDSTITRISRE